MVDGPLPGGEGPGDYGPVLEPTGPRDGAEYHEKSPVPVRDRRQPMCPLRPGLPEQRTSNYERHGTTSRFAAREVATGKVMGRCHRRHRHQEFPPIHSFMDLVDSQLPADAKEVHTVLDHCGTHQRVIRWFARHPRDHLHFTPTSGSWINRVEGWFAELTEKRIRRGSFLSVASLEKAIREYLDHYNENPNPFVGTAHADLILGKIQRLVNEFLPHPGSPPAQNRFPENSSANP
jgi:hypothetical protein